MIIDATEKSCRRILAYLLDQQIGTTGVFINEVGDIMNEASNDNQRSPQRLFLN
jgi:hypothetical protein